MTWLDTTESEQQVYAKLETPSHGLGLGIQRKKYTPTLPHIRFTSVCLCTV